MKPYHQIPIKDCGEPLIAIPLSNFAVELPHPYVKLGAEYGERSPYCLRQGVVKALLQAQFILEKRYPHWKIKIYDAYRPVGVQQFMVNYTYETLVKSHNLPEKQLSAQQRQDLWGQVYQLWAAPSLDRKMPPPHSTGAAVDVTIVNDRGEALDMGGEIDELSERSHPDYYISDRDGENQQYHFNRQLLYRVMTKAGFCQHPREWWHFSLGDQMWAWLRDRNQLTDKSVQTARYGRV
ncbi:D-alanyl-D-alanine dipeptidase [Waterburya agarophytonicola K14]|uniref:D-alanyl-D-alanine dipeptidase n=1 Tax=Waterburya agarophytonicola KI4 TaxID=2874699 RepID=A0A964BS39_9CYAN|nr:D-alanyl-D-alanine dipeptidase [Waterburya agarophytonicola KI4]